MIEIFNQEKIDGLEHCLSNNSLAYNLDISPLKDIKFAESKKWTATANLEQPDLFYLDSILATLGWNLNDDIFLKDEVIRAKDTPVDKPFNRMHVQEDIIGHMTASRLLDADYNVVSENDFEHIAVSSVIYRAWRDKEKNEEIEKTIAEILDGKWKVSMECLFNKFDYGLITAEGKQIIVERKPETSYLTKYLRAYNGPGIVNNNKIGRVLRDITFCGKGLVDNPGNPYSIIFNKSKKFFGAKASNIKELVMNELETAKAELDKAKAELDSIRLEVQKAAEAKWQAAISEKEAEIKSRDETIASLQADIKKLSENLASTQASIEAIELVKAEAIKGFEAVKAELDKIKAETTLANRRAALSQVVSADRVESMLEKFSSLSEEQFSELVTTLAGMPPWLKDKEDKKDKTDDEDKDKAMKTECSIVVDLAKAEVDTDVAGHTLASKSNDDMKAIVDYMVSKSKYKSLNKEEK
jgi:hypothetical protein